MQERILGEYNRRKGVKIIKNGKMEDGERGGGGERERETLTQRNRDSDNDDDRQT